METVLLLCCGTFLGFLGFLLFGAVLSAVGKIFDKYQKALKASLILNSAYYKTINAIINNNTQGNWEALDEPTKQVFRAFEDKQYQQILMIQKAIKELPEDIRNQLLEEFDFLQ